MKEGCEMDAGRADTDLAAFQELVEDLGHLRRIIKEQQALCDVDPVWVLNALIKLDQEPEDLQWQYY